MENSYKPVWRFAALAIAAIFALIYGVSSFFQQYNTFSIETFAGVLLGVLYIYVFSRIAEKRASEYISRGEGRYMKYQTGMKKEKAADVVARIPQESLDDYGKALKNDLKMLSKCNRVYAAILVVFYFLNMSR